MHSHHSHSGQYVQHAKDSLEEVIEEAKRYGMQLFCLTEHMPRLDSAHIYPEELESKTTVEDLVKTFDNFYQHARRLQREVKGIKLLVGTEVEHIDQRYYAYIAQIREQYDLDIIVGSIHHVDAIPIDYDLEKWVEARDRVGGAQALFERYFDDQYEMLQRVAPDVVGHFDLIKLFAKPELCGGIDPTNFCQNEAIWSRVERNIDYIVKMGFMIEINSAAIRKGWQTPYPSPEIAKLIVQKGGKFCLSDDSHGIAQVGLNYHKALAYAKELGVQNLYFKDTDLAQKSIPIKEVTCNVK